MRVLVRIDPKTLEPDFIRYDEPGPVPPIVEPDRPGEAKDGGPPNLKELDTEEPEQS